MVMTCCCAWGPISAATPGVASNEDGVGIHQATADNVVLFLADDLGYSDLGRFGGKLATPHLDQLAADGMRLTSFYVHPICTPSRAALLTGCYPQRIGMESVNSVRHSWGIHADEQLLPELLREAGFATGIFGKWHLGHRPQFWPLHHGFDVWFGTPGSNDHLSRLPDKWAKQVGSDVGLPYIHNDEIIDVGFPQSVLTSRSRDRAIEFIRRHADQRFFCYVPFNMPHTPLGVSERFQGRTGMGAYADVIAEIDAAVGAVLACLSELNLDENTIVIFCSDNGPWHIFGNHGGTALPFRGGKKQTLEGGVRSACIVRWKGVIGAGTSSDEMAAAMDILPTLATLTGASMPEKKIDGFDLSPLLLGRTEKGPRDSYAYYFKRRLQAVRLGRWKLQLPHDDTQAPDLIGNDGARGTIKSVPQSLALYDLKADPAESADLSGGHPQVVARLQEFADQVRSELGDELTNRLGAGVREVGTVSKGSVKD